jgi:hypothetical protein
MRWLSSMRVRPLALLILGTLVIVLVIAFGGLGRSTTKLTAPSVSVAHRDTYAAPLSAASDTYTASLSATTNAGAFSHSSCRLPATDAVGRI